MWHVMQDLATTTAMDTTALRLRLQEQAWALPLALSATTTTTTLAVVGSPAGTQLACCICAG